MWRYQFSKQSKAFPKCQKLELCHLNIVFKNVEEPGEKPFIEILRILPPAAAHLALTAHQPETLKPQLLSC